MERKTMPQVDWDSVEDTEPATRTLPPGWYECQLQAVDVGTTQHGDEMWTCKWGVIAGVHKERHFLDRWVWSRKGLQRIKIILKKLGLQPTGQASLEPEDIGGTYAHVEVKVQQYTDRNGVLRETNVPTLACFKPLQREDAPF
jgi:hypothetical protein